MQIILRRNNNHIIIKDSKQLCICKDTVELNYRKLFGGQSLNDIENSIESVIPLERKSRKRYERVYSRIEKNP